MLPFGVTILATVPQESEIPEGLMNNSVLTGHTFPTTFTCMKYDSHNNAIDLTSKKFSMQK